MPIVGDRFFYVPSAELSGYGAVPRRNSCLIRLLISFFYSPIILQLLSLRIYVGSLTLTSNFITNSLVYHPNDLGFLIYNFFSAT